MRWLVWRKTHHLNEQHPGWTNANFWKVLHDPDRRSKLGCSVCRPGNSSTTGQCWLDWPWLPAWWWFIAVKAWFEQLEIDVKFAGEITDIQQDGSNDIYLQLFPFWSGETEVFNIQSFEDIVYFPHLKKVELFHEDNRAVRGAKEAFLLEHGIEVE